MNAWERWSLHGLTVIVGVTGIAYWCMQHLLVTDDPFAVVNHPWQPAMLAGHVLAAPLLVLMFGIVFQSHVRAKIGRAGIPNRRSGLLALAGFGVMLVSGYLLQVVTADSWRTAALVAHLASGLVFLAAYAVHQVVSLRLAWSASARRRAADKAA